MKIFLLCHYIAQIHWTRYLFLLRCRLSSPDTLSYSTQSLTTFYIAEAMYTLKAILLICSIPFTLGQYGNPAPQSSSTSSTAASTASAAPASGVQVVTVGQNGLSFSPNSITAAVGSFVEFHFFPPTHSVAQSSFSTPCAPPSNGTGFWSGLIQSSGGQNVRLFFNHCIHNSLDLSC
jgi:plastocyanin